MFEYQGYHFKAIGTFPKRMTFEQKCRGCYSGTSPCFRNYDIKSYVLPWSWDEFYKASDNKQADVFICVETGTKFVPANNELFTYKGKYNPIAKEA